jgi:hypothetical protein
LIADNEAGRLSSQSTTSQAFTSFPYTSPNVGTEEMYIAAIDSAGGISIIHYKVYVRVQII